VLLVLPVLTRLMWLRIASGVTCYEKNNTHSIFIKGQFIHELNVST
jgi:hypothetical protein